MFHLQKEDIFSKINFAKFKQFPKWFLNTDSFLLSLFSSIKTETKIPIRQTCDEKKYNQNYKYYEMQEA